MKISVNDEVRMLRNEVAVSDLNQKIMDVVKGCAK